MEEKAEINRKIEKHDTKINKVDNEARRRNVFVYGLHECLN